MRKIVLILLLSCFSIILIGCTNSGDPADPGLLGGATVTLEVGETYTDPGVDYEDDERITITGEVDTSTIGTYTITYVIVVSDSKSVTLTRTVHVVDTTIPVITLTGGNVTINVGQTFSEPGYIATDNYDGDITNDVVVSGTVNTSTAGTYTVRYNVTDSSDNVALEKTRTVTVEAVSTNQPPVISLIGDALITISVGDTFTDQGVTASDPEDGDISASTIATGTVDTTTAGTYTITYTVSDSEGLAATPVTRTIIVEEVAVNVEPTITLIGQQSITISVGDTYTDQGATASDPEDGDISSNIIATGTVDTTTAGTYTITYTVSDSEGLAATLVTRTIIVEEVVINVAPTITLIGEEIISIYVGGTYTDQGATASDPEDGDISSSVLSTGTVDTSTIGTYTITYTVSDSEGLAADSITRTVHVVEEAVGGYQTIYVAKNLTIDWDSVLTNLGYTPVTVTIDTTIIGSYTIQVDNVALSVEVFDPNTIDFVILGGSILFLPSNLNWNNYVFKFSVPTFSLFDLSIYGGAMTSMRLEQTNSIYSIIEPMSCFTDYSTDVYLDQGLYEMMIETHGLYNGLVQINIEAKQLVTQQNPITVEHGLTSINSSLITQSALLDVTSQGEKEIVLYSNNPFTVSITDNAGNKVIEQIAVYQGYYYYFNLQQHFAVGSYTVTINYFEQASPINIFYTDGEYANHSYIDAIPLTINTIEQLTILESRDWYYVDITTDGYYHFTVLGASHHLYDFTIYDALLNQVAYGENYLYLESGQYYVHYQYFRGEVTFEVSQSYSVQTTNNDHTTATTVVLDTVYDVYFDEDQTDKWYMFTLTEDKVLNISLASFYAFSDEAFSLYDNVLEPIYLSFLQTYYHLPAGTYYLKAAGEEHSSTSFKIETLDVPNVTASVEHPYAFTLGEELYTYVHHDQTHIITFTLESDQTLEFYYLATRNADVIITGPNDYHFETTAYSGNPGYLSLLQGTYTIHLTPRHGSTIYHLVANIYSPTTMDTPYSIDINTAGYLDFTKNEFIIVSEAEVSVYVKILLDQDALLYGYPINTDYVYIYNSLGETVMEGSPWKLFPLPLSAGEYTMEVIPYEEGVVQLHEVYLKPIYNYGSIIADTTLLPHIYAIRGFNPTKDTVDIMRFTIDGDQYMTFDGFNIDNYQIFDENWAPVTPIIGGKSQDVLVHFVTGNYYIVVNSETRYYYINVYNVTTQEIGGSYTDASILYQNEQSAYFLPDNYTTGYYTFDVLGDTYLSFDYNNYDYIIEIFDEQYNPYLDVKFITGTYYIRLTSIKDCHGVCELEMIDMKVENINKKVINNTMASSIDAKTSGQFYGTIVDPNHQAWFDFSIDELSLSYFYINAPEATFTLYDFEGNIIDTITSGYYDLTIGDYYIKVTGNRSNYTYSLSTYPYEPISDTETNAKEIILNSTFNFDLTSLMNEITDVDWFTITLSEQVLYRVYISSYEYGAVTIYDSLGTQIGNFTSSGYIQLDPDTYTFKVTRGYVGPYSISFNNLNEYLLGETFETAREIHTQEWVYNYFLTYPKSLYYTFTLTSDALISFYKSGYSTDTMTIYASDMTTVITDYNLVAGTYYIEYHNADFVGRRSFVINVDSSNSGNDELGLDNTIDTPVVIPDRYFTLHQSSEGSSSSDFFSITLSEVTLYMIRDNYYTGGTIHIYDALDKTTPLSTHGTTYNNIFSLQPGDYIIEVTNTYGLYKLSFDAFIYNDYPSTLATATELIIYQQLHSYLLGQTDEDYFTLTLTNDAVLTFDGYNAVTFELYTLDDVLFSSSATVTYHELPAGDYYLIIKNNNDAFTEYNVRITDHAHKAFPSNHLLAETYPLYDTIYYVDGYLSANQAGYIKLIFTEDTEILWNCSICTLLDDTLLEVTTTIYPAGTYYLKLENSSNGEVSFGYTRIDRRLYDDTNPAMIQAGVYMYAYNKLSTDIDVFTITPTEDLYLYFSFQNNPYVSITIKDDLDNTMYNVYTNNYNLEDYPFMLRANITYTINVTNIIGHYRFILQSMPYIDISDTATNAEVITSTDMLSPIDGHIYDQFDEDWYTFTITESTEYSITTNNGVLEIFSSDGVTPYTSTVYTTGTYYIKLTNVAKADYSIMFSTP